MKFKKGFTLIELLVVIGILAVLLAITLIAINPARQFMQANNTKRSSDVNAILNAVTQYAADNRGNITPLNIPDTTTGAAVIGDGVGQVDLCDALVTLYLAGLPVDPLQPSDAPVTDCALAYNTNYTIVRSTLNNRITVAAPAAELGATISVTR